MPLKCCVPGCRSNYMGEYVTVFRFPKDENLKQDWLRWINRPDYLVTRNSSVCIRHFPEQYVRSSEAYRVLSDSRSVRHTLMPGALPTLGILVADWNKQPVPQRGRSRSIPTVGQLSAAQVIRSTAVNASGNQVATSIKAPPGFTIFRVPSDDPGHNHDAHSKNSTRRTVGGQASGLDPVPPLAIVKQEHHNGYGDNHRRIGDGGSSNVTVRKVECRIEPEPVLDGDGRWSMEAVQIQQPPCFMVSSLQDAAEHLDVLVPQLRDWTYLVKPDKLVIMKVSHDEDQGRWPPRISRSIVLSPNLSFALYDDRRLSPERLAALEIGFETVVQSHDIDFLIECLD